MEQLIEDVNIESITPIKQPNELKMEIVNRNPSLVVKSRQEIQDILHGKDTERLLMVVGPCSIHDKDAAYEYAERLSKLKDQLSDELVIVMRTYFEKPRTTVGWTGLVYDPNLDGSCDMSAGLAVSRQVLADVNDIGVSCAVEFLDPFTPQYFDDLVAWGAVGARTTESQPHRQLASGLSMPVGFKNSTDGNIKVAIDAMEAASKRHTFFGFDIFGRRSMVRTTGNPDTHIVLRGSNKSTNFDETSVNETTYSLIERGMITTDRPIMIDCSHGNSSKDHNRQLTVAENVLGQVKSGQYRIMGMMIESNIEAGNQKWILGKPLVYGMSITDACIGLKDTERLLFDSARVVHPKRYAAA